MQTCSLFTKSFTERGIIEDEYSKYIQTQKFIHFELFINSQGSKKET